MKIRISIGLILLLMTQLAFSAMTQPTVAFYYGPKPPINLLHNYAISIVDASSSLNPKSYNRSFSQAYAYASLGEIESNRSYFKQLPTVCKLGKNPQWKSVIINQAQPQCRQFILNHVIKPLWSKGYRGLFLDTLDSYKQVAKDSNAQKQQQLGLITLIKSIKQQYPHFNLIINRGFVLLPKIHQYVQAMAVESLFKSYQPIKPAQSRALLKHIQQLHQQYHLPIIVIDYAKEKQVAQQDAKHIAKLGFIPWVANKDLTQIGASSISPIRRKILVLYAKSSSSDLSHSAAFHLLAMPIEYLGYNPVFRTFEHSLPDMNYMRRFAGVIIYPSGNNILSKPSLPRWLKKLKHAQIKFILLGEFGFVPNANNLASLNIIPGERPNKPSKLKLHIAKQAPSIGFEIRPLANAFMYLPLHAQSAKVLLRVSSAKNHEDAVAITQWGGYALHPYILITLPNEQQRWIINPFQFIARALRLPNTLAPDTTAENGERLLLTEIDGDGIVSRSEWYPPRLAGQVMLKEIFDRYHLPTTVSVIEGEISPTGVYPKESKEITLIAREIFKLPWVEIASHTYSHPFNWLAQEAHPLKRYNLPIPNYRFSLTREIKGSAEYINQHLAPIGKRCKVMLWSGDTNPSAKGVALSYHAGMMNMNGGSTTISKINPTITAIDPLAIKKGRYYQIYSPINNENLYTNLWHGPFYGYKSVIQTFKMTYSPRHLKPIDIYYHFYSATKQASLNALKTVYNWALKQKVNPIYVSDYSHKVLDFFHLSMARQNDSWIIHSQGKLRQFKLPKSMGYPNFKLSNNVIGFSIDKDAEYIYLGPGHVTRLKLSKHLPTQAYLDHVNAQVSAFNVKKNGFDLALKGYLPVKLTLANMQHCQIRQDDKVLRPLSSVQGVESFALNGRENHVLQLRCQA